MCRSIKTLRGQEQPPTEEEIRAAALQFVRKLSGYRQPSRTNEDVFAAAVNEVADATKRLLDGLAPTPPRPARPPRVRDYSTRPSARS